jgi:hypothetical protein
MLPGAGIVAIPAHFLFPDYVGLIVTVRRGLYGWQWCKVYFRWDSALQ